MARDLGAECALEVETDSSASKGVLTRRGVGRIRHLHTPMLWVQERTSRGDIAVRKIAGVDNPADLGTKFVDAKQMELCLRRCGFAFAEGRSSQALRAALSSPHHRANRRRNRHHSS